MKAQKLKGEYYKDGFFPMNLCNLYSETSLRALEDWPEFIIHAYNLNNINYTNDTVLMKDSKGKIKEIFGNAVVESKKKGPIINSKKIEYKAKVASCCKLCNENI